MTNNIRRTAAAALAGTLACVILLSGCSGQSKEKQQEYKELGISRMESGEYEEAAEAFQNALEESHGTVGAQELDLSYYKALAQYKAGDTDGAIDTYSRLIEYDGDNWEVYYLRGCVYVQDGKIDAALEDYDEAVAQNSKDFSLYAGIYETLSAADAAERGDRFLAEALDLKVSDAEDYAGIGYIYYLADDYEKAVTNLKTAVEKGEDDALLTLGTTYAAQGDYENARSAFEKYMGSIPRMLRLAETAMSAEQYEDAVEYLTQALETADDGQTRSIQYELVVCYEKLQQYELALEQAESYTEAYPGDEDMQKEYQFLQTRTQD